MNPYFSITRHLAAKLLIFLLAACFCSLVPTTAIAQTRGNGGFNLSTSQYSIGVGGGFGANSGQFHSPGDPREISGGRIGEAAERILQLLEGNLGSLIMVAAGLGTIISAAFGAYRAAISLLVVAVGSFILRSLIRIFFESVL